MKLSWHNYLVSGLDNCAMKLCTVTSLRQCIVTMIFWTYLVQSFISGQVCISCVLGYKKNMPTTTALAATKIA